MLKYEDASAVGHLQVLLLSAIISSQSIQVLRKQYLTSNPQLHLIVERLLIARNQEWFVISCSSNHVKNGGRESKLYISLILTFC